LHINTLFYAKKYAAFVVMNVASTNTIIAGNALRLAMNVPKRVTSIIS
jgi:hypothetical protein